MAAIERLHRLVDELPAESWPDAEQRLRDLLDADPWERWDAAAAEMPRRPAGVTDEDVEADITAEMAAMREERRALFPSVMTARQEPRPPRLRLGGAPPSR